MTGLSLTTIITLLTLAGRDWISVENLRVMAAFASCLLFVKLYDWLRLFSSTAFYV